MADKEFLEVLRLRGLLLLKKATDRLTPHPDSPTGTMAPHVVQTNLICLRDLAEKMKLLAEVAERL